MGDLHALRRLRKVADADIADGDVEDVVLAFDEEVVVVGDLGVELGLPRPAGEHAPHACHGALVKRVVAGRKRDRHAGGDRFLMQLFGGQMPVALGEKQFGQCDPLPRRTKAGRSQPFVDRDTAEPCIESGIVDQFPMPFLQQSAEYDCRSI
jgi:hypothetical protein